MVVTKTLEAKAGSIFIFFNQYTVSVEARKVPKSAWDPIWIYTKLYWDTTNRFAHLFFFWKKNNLTSMDNLNSIERSNVCAGLRCVWYNI